MSQARHNLIYWRYEDYAGVGPGAHGRLTLDGVRAATEAERLPERWLQKVESKGSSLLREEIRSVDAAREHLLMALRLREGLDVAEYQRKWGVLLSKERIDALTQDGLVACESGVLSATPRGRLLLNSVVSELAV